MKRMIVSSVLVASVLCSIGCSSSYRVSSSPDGDRSFEAFSASISDRRGVIVLQDESELGARNIIASSDSTPYLNETTDSICVLPTQSIQRVVVRDHVAGLPEGMGWGAGIGAASSVAVALRGAYGKDVEATHVLSVTGMAVMGGAFVGGIVGVIIGHDYEYQFPPHAISATK